MFGWAKRLWTWLMTEADEDVALIQQHTVKLCGFLPTVQTVTAILGLGNPALQAASAIATAICRAVSKDKVSTLVSTPPTIEGIVIEGEYVGNNLNK
jgi:hypothetical protein